MSDFDIPLPEIGRQLSGQETQVLMNIRSDMEPILRRMFPRTSDAGKSEFELVSKKFNALCQSIEHECDAVWKDALAKRDVVAMYGLRTQVYDAFFQRFKDMTFDELLCLLAAQQGTQFLQRYPGLPTNLHGITNPNQFFMKGK